MNSSAFDKISVGILSFKAHKTIDATLDNYKKSGFFDVFKNVKLFFQSISDDDIKVAEKYGLEYVGRPDNVGIQDGMKWVFQNMDCDYVLYLENDLPLVADIDNVKKIINKGIELLENGSVDMVRLRARFNPGEQFSDINKYSKIYKPVEIDERFIDFDRLSKTSDFMRRIRRIFRPFKAIRMIGRSLYVEKNPDVLFPKYVKNAGGGYYVVDSSVINWTNQSILLSKKFFFQMLDFCEKHPRLGAYPFHFMEPELNCRWWRKQHFKIAVCDGIFTHNRLDR